MIKVDLNCDLGESFGAYTIGLDHKVIEHVSSVNIACGFHASDPLVMAKTVALAKENGVKIGAHPGFLDLMGFGRREMVISEEEAKAYVKYQIGALWAFCKAEKVEMQHVKPHGALYNMAGNDMKLAISIARGIKDFSSELIFLGLAGSKMIDAAKELGLKYAQEVFADRAYEEDGSLVNRSKEGAMIYDKNLAIDRVVRMVTQGKVEAITGKDIQIEVNSICVHGDNENALNFVKEISQKLSENDVTITPLSC